jgi:signal transduction histidine kinase
MERRWRRMKLFTNRDIKRLFLVLGCAAAAFMLLPQVLGGLNLKLLLLSLGFAAAVFAGCFWYFHKQQRMIDEAISTISRFASGDRDARIDSDHEGELFKLFHEVNTLATSLNAHAVREETAKDFLRSTIADISHQLKTPLAALAIYNALLQEECENGAAVRGFAVKSEKEIERIEILVQSLLKITRLDAGMVVMEQHSENLSDMMRELASRFETRAGRERKTILLSGAEDVVLLCNRDWLLEAVSNIVKNALDHLGAGGNVSASWSRLPASVRLTVKDNGSGIHPEDLHHIFKRFYRSRFSQDTQGIGLGLPLARAIVEAHGGTIAADSVPGKGSTFVMNFPNLTKL